MALARSVASASALVLALAAPRPNIIWIMSDDLGYGEVSAMPGHNSPITTPNIDALFASGTTFTSAYAGEAVCAPSRGTLMTAYHTGHAWIRGNHANPGPAGGDFPLRSTDFTLASLLQANGYHTVAVGKWGMGNLNSTGSPLKHGFDYYYGMVDQNDCHNMYPTLPSFFTDNGTATGFPSNANASRDVCMSSPNACTWSHERFTTKALDVIAAQGDAVARDGHAAAPLFLYLAFTDPHAGGWSGVLESGNPVPSDGGFANTSWPDVEKDHASVISNFQDVDVGRIVRALEAAGLRNDTIVMFASDNGPDNEGGHNVTFFNSAGPLRGYKRALYEGGIRVPFAVSWPGTIPAGVTSDYYFAFWDVMPTLADIVGIPASQMPADIDGISVAQAWLGGVGPAHPPLYWEFCTTDVFNNATPRTSAAWGHAVRDGNWKGVSFALGEPLELYDLSVDIGETNNVAAQNPDVVAHLQAVANASHVDNPYFPVIKCVGS